jgi:hypothetical protein
LGGMVKDRISTGQPVLSLSSAFLVTRCTRHPLREPEKIKYFSKNISARPQTIIRRIAYQQRFGALEVVKDLGLDMSHAIRYDTADWLLRCIMSTWLWKMGALRQGVGVIPAHSDRHWVPHIMSTQQPRSLSRPRLSCSHARAAWPRVRRSTGCMAQPPRMAGRVRPGRLWCVVHATTMLGAVPSGRSNAARHC